MCGMPLDDLRNLPATSVLEDVVGYLLELKCLSDKQVILKFFFLLMLYKPVFFDVTDILWA